MTEISLPFEFMPEPRWNTHLSCLASLCRAAARDLDIVDIAGLTGLAFRTSVTRRATPVGLYLSWAWGPSFTRWLSILGLDAEVCTHHGELASYDRWIDRQYDVINATLALGFPVLHWDNTGFGLILGRSGNSYLLSGVPDFTVHPIWFEQERFDEFTSRAIPGQGDDPPEPVALDRDALTCIIEPDACFIHLRGVCRFDPAEEAYASLYRAHMELNGRVEFPRHRDDMQTRYEPQFGTAAFERWRDDLKDGRVHNFGMVQTLQSLAEARRLAVEYLKRLPARIDPAYHGRLEQVTKFYERMLAHLRPVQSVYCMPLDSETQLTRSAWEACREALYQVSQTEKTAGRLLSSIVQELFE